MTLTFSLVTPCFNGAPYLAQAMASVLDQGYPALDYVVIDGGSTDGSQAIIEARAGRLSSWTSEPDQGMYDALNKGFRRSSGEIMGWLNADDKHLPWTLATVNEVFSSFPEVDWITTAQPLTWNAAGAPVRCRPRGPYGREAFLSGHFLPRPGTITQGWVQQESTFWRRSLWEKAGGRLDVSYALAADFELWCRFFHHSSLAMIDVPLGGFRRHGDQQSLNHLDRYRQEAISALKAHGGHPASGLATKLRRASERLGLARASGPIVRYDFDRDRWILAP
ncbi:MAG: glycosyltransferase family 2 protein [Magnetovibrionaceae bacterium]